MTPRCPYCNVDAQLVSGERVYPHRSDLSALKFWLCACGAYTGTHPNSPTHKPKGGLARAPTRAARIAAHTAFDQLWKRGHMRRSDAYTWLREQLGAERTPHIGFMNDAECAEVIRVCNNKVSPREGQ